MKKVNHTISDIILRFIKQNKECYKPISQTQISNLSKKLNVSFSKSYLEFLSVFGNDSFYSKDFYFYSLSELEKLNEYFKQQLNELKNDSISLEFDINDVFTFGAIFDGNDCFWFWNLNDNIANPTIYFIDTTYYGDQNTELKYTFMKCGNMDEFIKNELKKYEYEKWKRNC
ncbi:MAG: SMI1/KNR4 family protein [Winogradskyella sp.]|nr:SMI1/KNR4 family protein [Winogradskyella sp.]